AGLPKPSATRAAGSLSSRLPGDETPRRRAPLVHRLRAVEGFFLPAEQQPVHALDALREAVILVGHFVFPGAKAPATVDVAALERGLDRCERAVAVKGRCRVAAG